MENETAVAMAVCWDTLRAVKSDKKLVGTLVYCWADELVAWKEKPQAGEKVALTVGEKVDEKVGSKALW